MTSTSPDRVAQARDRWRRVKAIFVEALDLADAERTAYLERACEGDEDLRREIESLLRSDHDAGHFGETPAAALIQVVSAEPEAEVSRLGPGDRVGSYEVVGLVGAGGMGEVYHARDTRLGRDVAIKTVAVDSLDPSSHRRLLHEARHASLLNHPNICTIHEVGEADGVPYIVMELVDGRSLRDIRGDGPVGVPLALDYGIQIAGALAHAHERGIVHRDLKSSNIMIDREGRAIVLDFGLARRLPGGELPQPSESTVTVQHAMAGTLGYMAPEVLVGGRADARSDIWALGVLLYELVAGELPFDGRTPFETVSAIIGEPPPRLPRGVPLALRATIERCLAKDPAARYQCADDVRRALSSIARRHWMPFVRSAWQAGGVRIIRAGVAAAIGIGGFLLAGSLLSQRTEPAIRMPAVPTLAVLPLESAAGDAEAKYLSDGITDAIIMQTGALGTIRVISRTSAERTVATGKSVREVGAALGADAVVTGRLHQLPDVVRLEIDLLDTASGSILWSDTYERPLRDVLLLQATVVRTIAVTVTGTLRPEARDRLAMVRTVNPSAHEDFLKGRFQWNRRTRASLERAIAHFRRAVELDPTYAPAHAALADCYNQLGTVMVGTGSPRTFRPLAAAEAITALQIDPASADAHAALGYVYHYDWRWDEAERELRRAIELNPSYALARLWYANLLMSRLRLDEALREVLAARDLDPFSPITNTNVGWVLHFAGRPKEAADHLLRTLELDPTYEQARTRLIDALADSGDLESAFHHARELGRQLGSPHGPPITLAILHAKAGNRSEAQRLLDQLLETRRREYMPPSGFASVYALLGETDRAFYWLEQAFEERSNYMAYLAVNPIVDTLRADPRFTALLERTRLPASRHP